MLKMVSPLFPHRAGCHISKVVGALDIGHMSEVF